MHKEINYKEGDKITPNREFPPIPGIEFPDKGKVYTCESLFDVDGTLTVYLKEITSLTPRQIIYKGITYCVKAGHSLRTCYGAHCFDKVEPYSNNVSKELAEKACSPVIEIDQPVKELVQN